MAGGPGTLLVLPCLYSLMVRDRPGAVEAEEGQAEPPDHA